MKKIYLFTLLSLGFNGIAQDFDWAQKGGLYAYDYGYGIVNDNAGNVYVSGKYELQAADFSGTTVTCAGNHDIFLAKYTAGGALTWIKTGGGILGDYAESIACDGTNYVYIAGEIEGSNDLITFPGSTITLNTMGDNDIFLAKYDLDGNLIWARSAGSSNNEKALAITYDAAGNVFICGHYTNTATFGGTATINASGGKDIFVAKYDMNGNFVWVQNAGSPARDEAKAIKCDVAGNVYVCGFYSNGAVFSGTTLVSPNGYYQSFVAKYSNSGTLLWIKTGGGDYDDVAWSLTMDNAGLIYVAGEFNASAYFGPTQLITSGNADVFVACYDGSGTEQWVKGAGGPLNDRARGIGSNGTNIFITGQFGGAALFGGITLNAADSSDVFFANLNNVGNFVGAISVGGSADAYEPLGYESGIAICAEASGEVYATGGMLDGGVFGGTSLTAFSRTDMFVTNIPSLVTRIESVSADSKNLHIYPNPGNGNFTVELDQKANQKMEISVYNYLGQTIDKKTNNSLSKVNIDLTEQESGMYFIEIKAEDNTTITKKIVVQK